MAIAGELPEGRTQKGTFKKGTKGPPDQRGGVGGDQGCEKRNGGETGGVSVVLLYKLQTTMHAVLVPVHPALRMFFYAALFDDNVLVYNVATVRAESDWGIVAPVIQIWTPFPSHFGYLPKGPPPCRRAVCNLINIVMRTRTISKMSMGNGVAPMLTVGWACTFPTRPGRSSGHRRNKY